MRPGARVLAGAAGLGHAADPALSSRTGRALIGAAGAGLIGAAVFATDPVSGYPPGTPGALTQPSRTGAAVFATDPVSGYPPGTPGALTQPSRTGMIHNMAPDSPETNRFSWSVSEWLLVRQPHFRL
jgi:hypothetical protein